MKSTAKIKLTVSALAVTALMFSCTKEKKNSIAPLTMAQKITGTWDYVSVVNDANNNGLIDSTDAVDTTVAAMGIAITFNTNGTGSMPTFADTTKVPFSWMLTSDDTKVGIMLSGDTVYNYMDIVSCTGTDMQLKQGDTTSGVQWYNFIKQ